MVQHNSTRRFFPISDVPFAVRRRYSEARYNLLHLADAKPVAGRNNERATGQYSPNSGFADFPP